MLQGARVAVRGCGVPLGVTGCDSSPRILLPTRPGFHPHPQLAGPGLALPLSLWPLEELLPGGQPSSTASLSWELALGRAWDFTAPMPAQAVPSPCGERAPGCSAGPSCSCS